MNLIPDHTIACQKPLVIAACIAVSRPPLRPCHHRDCDVTPPRRQGFGVAPAELSPADSFSRRIPPAAVAEGRGSALGQHSRSGQGCAVALPGDDASAESSRKRACGNAENGRQRIRNHADPGANHGAARRRPSLLRRHWRADSCVSGGAPFFGQIAGRIRAPPETAWRHGFAPRHGLWRYRSHPTRNFAPTDQGSLGSRARQLGSLHALRSSRRLRAFSSARARRPIPKGRWGILPVRTEAQQPSWPWRPRPPTKQRRALRAKPLVRSGETVTLLWDQDGIRLVIPAVCLDAGGEGQRVRARIATSGRTLPAIVVRAGMLRAAS